MTAWQQARAIAALPGTVTVLIPLVVLVSTGADDGWGLGGGAAALPVLIGLTLIAAGFALWLWTVRLSLGSGKERWRPGTRPDTSSSPAPTATCATR